MSVKLTRTFDLLDFAHEKFFNKEIFAGKKAGKWIKYTSGTIKYKADLVSAALLKLGIKKGDLILNISDNRPEWNILDFGLGQIGAVHVPVFPTINKEELKYVLDEVQPKLIFLSNRLLAISIQKYADNIKIYNFTQNTNEYVEDFSTLLTLGEKAIKHIDLQSIKDSIKADDLASIIYTSGTSTMPKGVMLSHRNHVENAIATMAKAGLDHQMIHLSYLPLSHAYERTVIYTCILKGMLVYYNENLVNILSNFQLIKPNTFTSVPLLLNKIYKGIMEKGNELKGFSKVLYKWALKFIKRHHSRSSFSTTDKIKFYFYNRLVYKKLRQILGGRIQKVFIGGAALSDEIFTFFTLIGVPIYPGYGLTEMSPIISMNNLEYLKPRSVGQLLYNSMVKISDDGEILTKGTGKMLGYYKDKALTHTVIDDEGWLHTGDVGELDENMYLTIKGRIKDIFKTASGNYVYPESIENKLKISSYIANALVVGEYQSFLSAIILLEKSQIDKWAKENNHKLDENSLNTHTKLTELIHQEINNLYNTPKETLQIKKLHLTFDKWNVETGELTPSFKIKRKLLMNRYDEVIKSFY